MREKKREREKVKSAGHPRHFQIRELSLNAINHFDDFFSTRQSTGKIDKSGELLGRNFRQNEAEEKNVRGLFNRRARVWKYKKYKIKMKEKMCNERQNGLRLARVCLQAAGDKKETIEEVVDFKVVL